MSCAARTRSSRRRRLSSRGSSTRNRRSDERVHRRAPRRVRGRADLPRVGDRPVDVLRRQAAPAPRRLRVTLRDASCWSRSAGSTTHRAGSTARARCGGSCRREGVAVGALHGRAADAPGTAWRASSAASARRTTIPDEPGDRPARSGRSRLHRDRAQPLWVADFTYVTTWSGVVYVAFVIDAFSRRIVGWKADTTMRTSLVLDTLEMALWSRDRDGHARSPTADLPQRRRQSSTRASPSPAADRRRRRRVRRHRSATRYDNALAETTIGLFKTEKIHREGPWKHARRRRAGHAGMGRLVQPRTPALRLGGCSPGRV